MKEAPQYVRSKRGGFKRLHRRMRRTLCCKECGAELERTPSGYWTCPLLHGKLIPESVLLRRLSTMLRRHYPRFRAQRILKLRHKVKLWAARDEHARRLAAHNQRTSCPPSTTSP